MTVRVLLADDQPLLRPGFSMIIGAEPDMTVVGEATDGDQALALARALRPDIVLVDVRMPGTDGIEATRKIVAQVAQAKVIILTTFDLDEYAFTDLLASIRTVAAGDAVIAPSTTRRLLDSYATTFTLSGSDALRRQDTLAHLTPREREIFTEVAAGHTNQEIAHRMTPSDATVKTHVARALAKLQLRDRVQIVIFAYEHGLVGPPR